MKKKCYICKTIFYDNPQGLKYYNGICIKCQNQNDTDKKKNQKIEEINKKHTHIHELQNIDKRRKLIQEKAGQPLKKEEKHLTYDFDIGVIDIRDSDIHQTKKKTPQTKFEGSVRQLNESDRIKSITCAFCQLTICKELYLNPLVFLKNCDHVYHRECFAKMMKQGKYECCICNKSFFSNTNESDDENEDYF